MSILNVIFIMSLFIFSFVQTEAHENSELKYGSKVVFNADMLLSKWDARIFIQNGERVDPENVHSETPHCLLDGFYEMVLLPTDIPKGTEFGVVKHRGGKILLKTLDLKNNFFISCDRGAESFSYFYQENAISNIQSILGNLISIKK